tara:strand:- start:11383 stop:12348 length:966 start_codon:yes stop_codon:yes gene_type:complete
MSETPITYEKITTVDNDNSANASRVAAIDPAKNPHHNGFAGADKYETIVPFKKLPCETVYKGKNDHYIVLGRDRYGNKLQGKGMMSEEMCSMVDIVVGRHEGKAPLLDSKERPNKLNPNFALDSARIYICQRTDVDEYFNIARSDSKSMSFKDRSAIAIKADNLRFMAREKIKLVTKVNDKISTADIDSGKFGIDLIALNDDSDLQPIPKGDTLVEALREMVFQIDKLNALVGDFINYQMDWNQLVAKHKHYDRLHGKLTGPSPALSELSTGKSVLKKINMDLRKKLGKHNENSTKVITKYLSAPAGGGEAKINSRYNKTN